MGFTLLQIAVPQAHLNVLSTPHKATNVKKKVEIIQGKSFLLISSIKLSEEEYFNK